MSKEFTEDDVINLKKQCFKKLNALLEGLIAKPTPATGSDANYQKKAALISKWITQYTNYLSFEEKFNPHKLINYKRGDIVFVNFGFNVGAEFGGEHYAVVIDKNNDRNSSTITVVPLSSFKPGKGVHPNDLYLGNELYEKLQLKLKTLIPQLKEQCDKNTFLLELIKDKKAAISTATDIDDLTLLIEELEAKNDQLFNEISKAEKVKQELLSLKQGSVAKIQQITTISKMRIYNPKNSSHPLYGIRFSEESMKLINAKLKELFVFEE